MTVWSLKLSKVILEMMLCLKHSFIIERYVHVGISIWNQLSVFEIMGYLTRYIFIVMFCALFCLQNQLWNDSSFKIFLPIWSGARFSTEAVILIPNCWSVSFSSQFYLHTSLFSLSFFYRNLWFIFKINLVEKLNMDSKQLYMCFLC